MIARLPGVSSAPPIPWTTLAAIRISAFGATAHSTDATANQITPMLKIRAGRIGPERAAQQDQRREGQQVAVDDPLEPGASAPRSSPIAGRATLTTVASRNAMPEPSTVTPSTHRPAALE